MMSAALAGKGKEAAADPNLALNITVYYSPSTLLRGALTVVHGWTLVRHPPPTVSAPDGTHEIPGVTETTEHDSTVAPPFRRSGLTLLSGRASYQRCTSMWHGVSDLAMSIDRGQPRAHRRQMYRDLLACEAVRQPCLAAIVLPGPARRRADIPNVYTRL